MASTKTLNSLFDELVTILKRQLKEGRQVLTKDGEVVNVDPDAATLNVVRQLLKDNGIEADGDENEALKGLRDSLPFSPVETPETSHLN